MGSDQVGAVVICVRHPDHDNEFHVFGDVEVFDIDLGRSDLRDPEEFRRWIESHEESIRKLDARGFVVASAKYEDIIYGSETP